MLYAQFYQYGAVTKDKLFEACGDRSVIIYDGRLRPETVTNDAKQECARRGYKAFAMFRGESFTRSTRVTPIQTI